MRFYIAIILLVLQLWLYGSAVCANPITYTAPTAAEPGKFDGELPVDKIGPLLLPDGLIQFSGDELKVGAVPDWLFDRDIVLSGPVVYAEVVPEKNISHVNGLVYFLDGTWLSNLGSNKRVDVISTKSGEQLHGRIAGRSGQVFVFKTSDGGTKNINFSDITSISSPRAYVFSIPTPTTKLAPANTSLAFEATLIKFTPTALNAVAINSRGATVPKTNLPGSDEGVSNHAIATFLAIDIINDIAPAIAIPLTLQPATQRAALNEINRFLQQQRETSGM